MKTVGQLFAYGNPSVKFAPFESKSQNYQRSDSENRVSKSLRTLLDLEKTQSYEFSFDGFVRIFLGVTVGFRFFSKIVRIKICAYLF
jgi:hypothetical protein